MDELTPALAALRRANRTLYDLLAERRGCDVGDFYVPREQRLSELAWLADAVLSEDDTDGRATYAAVTRWIPAVGQDIGLHERLAGELGYGRADQIVWRAPVVAPPPATARLRFAPARSMQAAWTAFAAERAAELSLDPAALVEMKRVLLDHPGFDAFVALEGTAAVAAVALLTVGPIGRVTDLFVTRPLRGSGLGRLLVEHVLRAATRWALQTVVAESARQDAACAGVLRAAGFSPAGVLPTFVRGDGAAPVVWA